MATKVFDQIERIGQDRSAPRPAAGKYPRAVRLAIIVGGSAALWLLIFAIAF